MAFEIHFTDEFDAWWNDLTLEEQASVEAVVQLLAIDGLSLRDPMPTRSTALGTRI